MESPIVYVPIRFDPIPIDSGNAITIVPGVTLHRISDEAIAAGHFGTIPSLSFAATNLLRIDADIYEAGARERLEKTGQYQSSPVIQDGGTFVSASGIGRWAVTSLILNSPFNFDIGQHYRTIRKASSAQETTVSDGGGELHRARFLPPGRNPGHLDRSSLTEIAILIEEYFRLQPFRMDRIAVALATYWTTACARYPEQTYLGLFTVLESLLSTSEQETTHQLAERTAIIARARGGDGVAAYKSIKKLYGFRSNIVHGRGATKEDIRYVKKRLRAKTPLVEKDIELLLHPMSRIVPMGDLMDLWGVTCELFRMMLLVPGLYRALRSGEDQEVDAIFLSELVGKGGAGVR